MSDIDPSDSTPRDEFVESIERQVALLTKELAETIQRIDCAACRANLIEYVRARLVHETTRNPNANKFCNEHAVASTRP
jgi:RNase P subunit RPR2